VRALARLRSISDGDADFVVANNYTETGQYDGSILLGNGDGTFAAPVSFALGLAPSSLSVGDLDGDGDADLAAANPSLANHVSIVLGNGDGTFATPVSYPEGAVTAMRAAAGLGVATFTDSPLVAGVTAIRREHITELRTALDEARTALGLGALAYTDPTITAQITTMKAAHVTEIRAGTQ